MFLCVLLVILYFYIIMIIVIFSKLQNLFLNMVEQNIKGERGNNNENIVVESESRIISLFVMWYFENKSFRRKSHRELSLFISLYIIKNEAVNLGFYFDIHFYLRFSVAKPIQLTEITHKIEKESTWLIWILVNTSIFKTSVCLCVLIGRMCLSSFTLLLNSLPIFEISQIGFLKKKTLSFWGKAASIWVRWFDPPPSEMFFWLVNT